MPDLPGLLRQGRFVALAYRHADMLELYISKVVAATFLVWPSLGAFASRCVQIDDGSPTALPGHWLAVGLPRRE